MLISETYRAQNAEMFETKPDYGTSGARWAPFADEMAISIGAKTLLDYGCGRGLLRKALLEMGRPGYQVLEYDPAFPGKDVKPSKADLVVCGDVMEHVEPECVYSVLDDIYNTARKGVLFVVATVPAAKHLPDGRNAHLVIEPPDWWLPKLMQRWRIMAFRDYRTHFVFTGLVK